MAEVYHVYQCDSEEEHRYASKSDKAPAACWRCNPETPLKKIGQVERQEGESPKHWQIRALMVKASQ